MTDELQLPGFEDEESKEPSERSTEEPDAVFDWIRSELAAGRNPGLIQQDEKGKEQEDADP